MKTKRERWMRRMGAVILSGVLMAGVMWQASSPTVLALENNGGGKCGKPGGKS